MDSLHEAHLERILENRRRRGVLTNYTNRRQSSICTQTQVLGNPGSTEYPPLRKTDSIPSSHGMPDYVSAGKCAPRENNPQTIQAVADSERSSRVGDGITRRFQGTGPALNSNGLAYGVMSNSRRHTPRFDDRSSSKFGGCRLWGTHSLRFGRRSPGKFSVLSDGGTYNLTSGRVLSRNRSPCSTVPLLTYGLPDATPSRFWRGESRRGRTLSPRVFRPLSYSGRSFSRDRGVLGIRGGENRICSLYYGSSENRVDSPRVLRQGPTRHHRSNVADKILPVFSDEGKKQAASSVIYTGGDSGNEKGSFSSSRRRQLPVLPLPEGLSPSAAQYDLSTVQNNGVGGLSSTRTTLDIYTSVSILVAGDWFYKWTSNGTSVSPRWVWLDSQNHLLLWAHKKTYECAFAGVIKLEKMLRVDFCELQQPDIDGAQKTYYVLLLETSKRILQLATEQHNKANMWHEALTNVMSYLKLHSFDVSRTYSMT